MAEPINNNFFDAVSTLKKEVSGKSPQDIKDTQLADLVYNEGWKQIRNMIESKITLLKLNSRGVKENEDKEMCLMRKLLVEILEDFFGDVINKIESTAKFVNKE